MSKKPGVKAPKKDKQQAASLARRMAGKKGQTTQLQIEVNNEEDWEKLLTREGIILIDVYSEWSGPCVGMIGNLKKAKVEFGGDSLHLAIAKSDEIEALKRFRNKSEPTWMFVSNGLLITVNFGANAPKLMALIAQELKLEAKTPKPEVKRGVPIDQLCHEEIQRMEEAQRMKSEAERQEEERKAREALERRLKVYRQMAEHLIYETVVIIFPHTIDPERGCSMTTELDLLWRSQMVYVAHQHKAVLTKDVFDEIFFLGGLEPTDDLFEDLDSGPCIILLLRCQIIASPGQEGEKRPGDIEKQICEAVNNVKLEPNQELVIPNPNSLSARYPYIRTTEVLEVGGGEEEEEEMPVSEPEEPTEEVTSVPGCWTPASYVTKCAAIRYLFPARAEKVMAPEEAPVPPKVVIAFDVAKQKDCFDLIEEHPDEVLDIGYFCGADPDTAEPLCATPEQYAMIEHTENDKLVIVVKKVKSEPLLSFAGLGAVYVSQNETVGIAEANLLFPPGVQPKYPKVEEAKLALQRGMVEEEPEEEEIVEEEEESEQDEDDLMALLGLTAV